jgi:RimJ/RimL family protein N-acetyltransferase
LSEEDIIPWAPFFENSEAIRFLGISALNLSSKEEISAHMIGKQLDRYASKRFGLQKLLLKDTNTFIGLCGLLLQELDGEHVIEIGYHLFPAHWGKGYATEAAALFEVYAFDQLNCPFVVSVIDKENYRSQSVALRNGFEIEKETTWMEGEQVYIYKKQNTHSSSEM